MRGQVPSQRSVTREGAVYFLAGHKIIFGRKNVDFFRDLAPDEVNVSLFLFIKIFPFF